MEPFTGELLQRGEAGTPRSFHRLRPEAAPDQDHPAGRGASGYRMDSARQDSERAAYQVLGPPRFSRRYCAVAQELSHG